MKKFLIIGSSLRSKGAEAMILETYKKIKEIDPANQVSLLVLDVEYNINLLKRLPVSADIHVIEAKKSILVQNEYINFILNMILLCYDHLLANYYKVINQNSDKRNFKTNLWKTINNIDIIIQVPGISFTDNFDILTAIYWAQQMIMAKLIGKKYYCMPQSFGPSRSLLITLCAKIGLENVTHIMPRGNKSVEFIEGLHLKNQNITFVPDLAFSFENPGSQEDEIIYQRFEISKKRKYIGVIFNSHLFHWKKTTIIDMVSNEIDRLISTYNYDVILIAHEVNDENRIDDRFMNTLIFERCTKKDKILVINEDLRANEIKSLIKLCDFTICSRFHGMISSLKVGVIPIVIGWADKYFEIMELFDLEYLVLDYNDITIKALHEKIEQVIQNKSEIKNIIDHRISQYEKGSDIIKEIITH